MEERAERREEFRVVPLLLVAPKRLKVQRRLPGILPAPGSRKARRAQAIENYLSVWGEKPTSEFQGSPSRPSD